MLDKAISIAGNAFVGVYDKGGNPYILHCLEVMNHVKPMGEKAMVVAVLHDLLEDTNWTASDLIKSGIDEYTVSLIEMMTHKKDEDYFDDYIKRVSMNKITRSVKMADLCHNSNITRMKGLREKDFKRLEKYHRAYAYLQSVE
jgi:(p)ppGpp synthase/HD superfamily hydrolase